MCQMNYDVLEQGLLNTDKEGECYFDLRPFSVAAPMLKAEKQEIDPRQRFIFSNLTGWTT